MSMLVNMGIGALTTCIFIGWLYYRLEIIENRIEQEADFSARQLSSKAFRGEVEIRNIVNKFDIRLAGLEQAVLELTAKVAAKDKKKEKGDGLQARRDDEATGRNIERDKESV